LIKIYAAQGLTQEALKSCRVILAMHPTDEEALSVQFSLGTQTTQQPPSTEEPQPEAALTGTPVTAQTTQNSSPPEDSDSPASKQSAPRRDAVIAQLESWLRSLDRRRRDRPTSHLQRLIP